MNLQDITPKDFEHIEKYLNNNLDAKEEEQFKLRLQTDTEFQSKVEEIKTILTGIETQALKEQLNLFHEDFEKDTVNTKIKNPKVHALNWKRLLVAAVIIIAAGSFWFLTGNTNERLYAKYFSPDPGLPTTMSNSDNYEFYEAMVTYKQGDYHTAITKWEALQRSKPNNDTLNYFIGVAYLANENETNAILYLEKVIKNPEFVFVNDANFYLGLAYLKTKNIEKAKARLQNSTGDNSKALLSELND